MKMYLLRGHNPLNINSGSYLFDNFFSFMFLRNARNLWILLISKVDVKCGDHSIQDPNGFSFVNHSIQNLKVNHFTNVSNLLILRK